MVTSDMTSPSLMDALRRAPEVAGARRGARDRSHSKLSSGRRWCARHTLAESQCLEELAEHTPPRMPRCASTNRCALPFVILRRSCSGPLRSRTIALRRPRWRAHLWITMRIWAGGVRGLRPLSSRIRRRDDGIALLKSDRPILSFEQMSVNIVPASRG